MKISCPSCSAKYSIADEKVQDRLAKIRCRKCGTTIVIDGKQDPPSVRAADANAKDETDAHGATGAADGAYTVDVADDDQRSMTLSDIVAAYNSGVVTADTYVWKDGMGDWEPLADVAEINEALHAAAATGPGDDDPTAAFDGAGLVAGALAAEAATASKPIAAAEPALRSGAGRGSAADLFGSIDTAGSEQDITTSAAGHTIAATGARNESSVLFSLSALTAAPNTNDTKSGVTEDSGLIDLAALTASSAHDSSPGAAFDFGAAPLGAGPLVAAPLGLAAAASPGFSVDALPAQQTGGNTRFFAVLAAVVVLGLFGIYMVLSMKDEPGAAAAIATTVVLTAAPAPDTAPGAEANTAAAAAAEGENARPDTEEPGAKNDAVATTKTAPNKKRIYTQPRTKSTPPGSTERPTTTKKAPAPAAAEPVKKKKACNCKPNDLMCAMKCSAK